MVTHSMENILSMQQYYPPEALHSPPSRKKRCLPKEQDPMSHRIIEKRRRDRMNNCLADLSRLIPPEYLKKGRGRVEKTEIIEMAIRHMKHLQGVRQETKHTSPTPQPVQVHAVHGEDSVDSVTHPSSGSGSASSTTTTNSSSAAEHFRLGFQECLSETMHFLVENESFYTRDDLCVQLVSHLQRHCDKVLASSDRLGSLHHDLPTVNNVEANGGVNQFAHANGGPLSTMCSNVNGVSHLNNNNNNNNNSSHSNLNNIQQQQHPHVIGSSFESVVQRPLLNIPPPSLVSDDSNHSCHSHASFTPEAPRQSAHPTNYKFKNSIKQRFSAEIVKTSPRSPPPTCSSSDASSSKHSSSGGGSPQHQGVPIFALHDHGGFYVPLTVEAAILRPHMGYPELAPEPVLHPVTISVNFNHATTPVWSPSSHQSPLSPPAQ